MDKAAQYYIWFLVVVTGLSALVRLVRPRLYAEVESERLSDSRTRRTRTWMGVGAIVLSPLILLYHFWGPLRPWMWLSVGVGVLSGVEQWTAARYHDFRGMLWHTRVFGIVSAAVALAIYVFYLRK